MKILLKISYVGTDYCGWQSQKNGRSVQEAVTDAAGRLFGFECDVTGCSRTDSGVHAKGFGATISEKGKASIETSIPLDKLPRAMNSFLPDDISVISAEYRDDDFHARYDVVSKRYSYVIRTCPERDAFLGGRVWNYGRSLDVESMYRAAKYFVGKHDFTSFMAAGSKITDAVRTVFAADVKYNEENCEIVYSVSADGFLYNMVRIMVGTLVDVGEHRIKPEDIERIINEKDRSKAGATAPADGLYLEYVEYKD